MRALVRAFGITATLSALIISGLTAGAAAGAAARETAARETTAPLGYVYASTFSDVIDRLAVQPDHSLKLIGTVPTAAPTYGLALLHTAGGVHLYALDRTGPSIESSIYEYSVNVATGALTADKAPPVTGVISGFIGNNLLAFDGHATSASDASAIYAYACTTSACAQGGFAHYVANQQTGQLKLTGLSAAIELSGFSIHGDQIDELAASPKGGGSDLIPLLIDPKTSNLKTGARYGLTTTSSQTPAYSDVVTTGLNVVGVGDLSQGAGKGSVEEVYGSNGLKIFAGGSAKEADEISALGFIPHLLLAGEVGKTYGPQLELFAPDGGASGGTIDLTKSPYDLPVGSEEDPDFTETIFQLGQGVYIGTYSGRVVQATDGVGGKGLLIDKTAPTVAGTGQATSMTGYLLPAKKATTIKLTVHMKAGTAHVSGSVSGGVPGVKVTVSIARKSGGTFHTLHTKKPALSSAHTFATTFPRPPAGTCRVTARYPGTPTTKPSQATKTLPC